MTPRDSSKCSVQLRKHKVGVSCADVGKDSEMLNSITTGNFKSALADLARGTTTLSNLIQRVLYSCELKSAFGMWAIAVI